VDVVEVFVRDVMIPRSFTKNEKETSRHPRWERAVFEDITSSGFVRVKMINGSMRLFDMGDVRSVTT